MMSAKDLALNVSLAAYARDLSAPAVVTVTSQKLVKVSRPKAERKAAAPKATAKPVESVAQPTTPSPNGAVAAVVLPAAGTLGAKAFIMMMNRAKDRQEKICAIAGYCGWDGRLDYGQQESAAFSKAKAEIRPINTSGPTREEQRQAARSATGYVAGMPDALKRTVQDLIGRENLAVMTRNDHVRDARDHSRTMMARKLSIGLARLEQERLTQIRADLARFVP